MTESCHITISVQRPCVLLGGCFFKTAKVEWIPALRFTLYLLISLKKALGVMLSLSWWAAKASLWKYAQLAFSTWKKPDKVDWLDRFLKVKCNAWCYVTISAKGWIVFVTSSVKCVSTRNILYKKQSILDTSLDFTTYKKRVTSLLLQWNFRIWLVFLIKRFL